MVETAELALSELVTNVVMHARTTAEVTLHLGGGVLSVAVRDWGGAVAAVEPAWPVELPGDDDPLLVFGRGLGLVAALVDRWGTGRDLTGTTAWFQLELADQEAERAQRG